jgi:hypothetical protein
MKKVVIGQKKTFKEYLFYACMGIVLLWLVLKSAGIIKTPFWLESGLPVGTFVLGVIVFFQTNMEKLSQIQSDIARMQVQLMHHDKDLERIKDALFAK